ncbi:chalcone isomerase family protein [Guyparkeria sp.]|uniref:chalcone isomerase family protein n=1 Tax=Guyparkeria sp. TaxID=2035736 RepID=UPI0035626C4C
MTRAMLLAAALAVTSGVNATGMAADFGKTLDEADTTLVLTGAGTASYMIWDVYDAALYAPASAEQAAIMAAEVPMTLVLDYHRDVAVADIRKAAWKALDGQYDEASRDALRPKVETLHDAMSDVGDGDRYQLDWRPKMETGEGRLVLKLNGQTRFASDDAELARAYFGIWLGEPPLSGKLRQALLSRRG